MTQAVLSILIKINKGFIKKFKGNKVGDIVVCIHNNFQANLEINKKYIIININRLAESYKIISENKIEDEYEVIGTFKDHHFISLSEYRDKNIDDLLNED